MSRLMTDEQLAAFSSGDQVRVTTPEPPYSEVGDIATLTRMDAQGDWWGEIQPGDEICLSDVAAFEAWALIDEPAVNA